MALLERLCLYCAASAVELSGQVWQRHPQGPSRQGYCTCRTPILSSTINAKSETAATKPAFRDPLKFRRCLIPADGFYEWKRTPTNKQPYCFEVNDGEVFAFAGLWDGWKN